MGILPLYVRSLGATKFGHLHDGCVMARRSPANGRLFLQSWWYTQDKWVLSLIPISSLVFEIVGPRPELAVLLGWLTFVVSVAR